MGDAFGEGVDMGGSPAMGSSAAGDVLGMGEWLRASGGTRFPVGEAMVAGVWLMPGDAATAVAGDVLLAAVCAPGTGIACARCGEVLATEGTLVEAADAEMSWEAVPGGLI